MSIEKITTSVPYDSNVYLVSGDRPVLVDAGTGLDSGTVISEVRRMCPAGISSIVVTHCHYDHVGGLRDLVDAFGCPAYAGRRDAPHIRSPDEVTSASMFGGTMRAVDVLDLSEGDVIDTGDHRLRVIETLGHTKGGICLFDDSLGWLISGDTLFCMGYGRTDLPTGSMTEMRESLLRLSKIDIRGVFPGHGSTCESYTPGMMAEVLRMAGV